MMTFRIHDAQDQGIQFEHDRLLALANDLGAIGRGVPPEDLAGEQAPLLDHWIIGHRIIPCLGGLSTGHPLLSGDNRLIRTSDLWLMSDDRGWARTLSRWYRLGREVGHGDLQS